MKECPYCLRELADSAIVCKYCRKRIKSQNNIIETPWGLKDLFLIGILTIISYYAVGFLLSYLLMFFGLDRNAARLIINNLLEIIFVIAIFFNVTVIYNRDFLQSLKLCLPTKKFNLFLYPIIAIGLFYFFRCFPAISKDPPLAQLLTADIDITVLIVSAVLVAPIFEEVVWRGYVFPVAQKKMGIFGAICLVTVLFTLTHLPQLFGAWPILAKIFIVSFAYTLVRGLTNSTLASIILHFSYNLIVALSYIFKF